MDQSPSEKFRILASQLMSDIGLDYEAGEQDYVCEDDYERFFTDSEVYNIKEHIFDYIYDEQTMRLYLMSGGTFDDVPYLQHLLAPAKCSDCDEFPEEFP